MGCYRGPRSQMTITRLVSLTIFLVGTACLFGFTLARGIPIPGGESVKEYADAASGDSAVHGTRRNGTFSPDFSGGHLFQHGHVVFFLSSSGDVGMDEEITVELVLEGARIPLDLPWVHNGPLGLLKTTTAPVSGSCRLYWFEVSKSSSFVARWPVYGALTTKESEGWCPSPTDPNLALFSSVLDLLIALAYFSIPFELIFFIRRSPHFPFPSVFFMFGAFIASCGATHIVGALVPWPYLPLYGAHIAVKLATAAVSLFTAGALLIIIPKAFELPVYARAMELALSERLLTVRSLRDENESLEAFRTITHGIRTKALDSRPDILRFTGSEVAQVFLRGDQRWGRCLVYLPFVQEKGGSESRQTEAFLWCFYEHVKGEDEDSVASVKSVILSANMPSVRLSLTSTAPVEVNDSTMPDDLSVFQDLFGGYENGVITSVLLVRILVPQNTSVFSADADLDTVLSTASESFLLSGLESTSHSGEPHSYGLIVLVRHIPAHRVFETGDELTEPFLSTRNLYTPLKQIPPRALRREFPQAFTWGVNTSLLSDVVEQTSISLARASLLDGNKLRIKQLAEQNVVLMQARKEAQLAKGQREFLAIMSHEMRTPLYAVTALSSMMLELPFLQNFQNSTSTIEERQVLELIDMLEVVKRSGDMLITIVNNILDFTKVEEEALNLEKRPFGVREAIETSMEIVTVQDDKGSNPHINVKIDPVVPIALVGDFTRVRQIIVNLLSNACKFTPRDGDVLITLNAEPVNQSGQDVQTRRKVKLLGAVIDTGVGVPEEHRKKLFVKFSQADASITRKFGGTGLGLAIVKKLCALMEGDVSVDDNTDAKKGTVFRFNLTLDSYHEGDWDVKSRPPPPLVQNPAFSNKHVWCIDFHDRNLEGIASTLDAAGCHNYSMAHSLVEFLAVIGAVSPTEQPFLPQTCHGVIIDMRTIVEKEELSLMRRFLSWWPDSPKRIMILCNPALHKVARRQIGYLGTRMSGAPGSSPESIVMATKPVKYSSLWKFLNGLPNGPVPNHPGPEGHYLGDINSLSSYSSAVSIPMTPPVLPHRHSNRLAQALTIIPLAGDERSPSESLHSRNFRASQQPPPTPGSFLTASPGSSPASNDASFAAAVSGPTRESQHSRDYFSFQPKRSRGSAHPTSRQYDTSAKGDERESGTSDHPTETGLPPRLATLSAPSRPPLMVTLAQSNSEVPLPSYNILVVEDNQINQMVTGRILQKLGQKFEVADDGIKALALFQEGRSFDIVLMDISMPRMDGYQCAREIRKTLGGNAPERRSAASPTKPWIIALTANALYDDRVRALEAGMNDFVPKPAKQSDIVDALVRYLEQG
ncbi:hypothetical protein M427DRAFT_220489 [Gonapodya prolifera JEL478]|uniref:Histidine kinase n=1 Tax=Gonapodya prolifera (strain JEL478) TaxID=1344416 RepID=A0A138ZYN8_GONPJ|nr:hypothetical protein M427DRAFT_220489 [Gonapodya prolifera JEL478]|eukprot:KXS09591.1 hypothetical protein M427DRAFT_220489 [Gonapodya prolifera JEL478]